MSFAKSKNDFSKKDMNFFSEFNSGASQQISSAFPIFLLVAIVILAVTLIVWIVCGIQIMKKQDRIDEIRAEMVSPEYQERLSRKDKSQLEVEDLREYYYVISTLDARVADKTSSSVQTLIDCRNALPDDAILLSYHDEDGVVEIHGQTLKRESTYNYGKLLEDLGIFSFIETEIHIMDPIEAGYDKETLMFANVLYVFTYKCTLNGHYTLTYASFIDGTNPTPLTATVSVMKESGANYELKDINTIVVDGTTYKLNGVKINDTAVDATKLSEIKDNNCLSGKMGSNMDVKFMYIQADDSNGGES